MGWARCSELFQVWPARQTTSNITFLFPASRGCLLPRSRWAQVPISLQRAKRRFTKRRFPVSARKWRKIRRKKSKRCRSSTNCRDSRPKNHKEWRSASPSSRSSSCRRWHKVSSDSPSTVSRINGLLRPRRAFRLRLVRSSQLSLSFSWAEFQR